MSKIFLGIPTYNGWMTAGCSQAANGTPSQEHEVLSLAQPGSLLCGNCNKLLTMALNLGGINWFALLHADISPEPFYIDKMIEEAETHGADMLSACVAIKNVKGVTSTAIGSGRRFGQFGRLTFKQIRHPDFPETFDINDAADALEQLPPPLGVRIPRFALLANTGCMIVRLDREWSRRLVFKTFDRIVQLPNGEFQNQDLSEDWYFSWRVAKLGGKVMCTTKIKAIHRGEFEFPNDRDWPQGIANECGVFDIPQTREVKAISRKVAVCSG